MDDNVVQQPESEVDCANSPRRHRVLVISHVGDNRFKNGGTVYTRSLLELMKSGCPGVETELVFFTRQKSAMIRYFRQAKALIYARFSRWPSKALYFRSRQFEKMLVSKLSSEEYALVIFDHAEMLWCLEQIPRSVPVLAVAHNIESKIYEQFLRHRPVSRKLFSWDLAKYQQFEEERLARVRNVVAISSDDAKTLRDSIPGLRVLVVPPTFSYMPASRRREVHRPLRLGLLGNFGWWPNREGYEWFINKVWARIESQCELHVFGAQSDLLPDAPRTVSHGYVNKLSDVWQSVDLMINPVISGSGVNVKVAEGVHNGMPMICTPMAVAGLFTKPDPAIVVLEHAEQWVEILNGDAVSKLARQVPKHSTRSHVETSNHAVPFAAFLGSVIMKDGPGASR